MVDPHELRNFLNSEGKFKSWPSKRGFQLLALEYIAELFEEDKKYTEKEVNDIIANIIKFDDVAIVRRGLIENKHFKRTPDGKQYWRET
jgi:hypothetical protein